MLTLATPSVLSGPQSITSRRSDVSLRSKQRLRPLHSSYTAPYGPHCTHDLREDGNVPRETCSEAQNVAWRIPAKPGIFLAVRLDDRPRKLEGERIELRRHARENYYLYAEWYGDPEIWHLTSWAPSPLSRSAVERLFDDRELSKTDDSFAIHVRGDDKPIGVISLMNKSEANVRLLRYAFEELGLNRIGLSVFDFNEEAISAYEKLGFVVEGRFRQAIKRRSGFHDAIFMSILKSECEPSF